MKKKNVAKDLESQKRNLGSSVVPVVKPMVTPVKKPVYAESEAVPKPANDTPSTDPKEKKKAGRQTKGDPETI